MAGMKIILSPAKKMNVDTDSIGVLGLPAFLPRTAKLLEWIRNKSYGELKALWKCNDKIAEENFQRFQNMELTRQLTPALLSYEGIAYQYMAPGIFTDRQWRYVGEHLRILSGFYGILKPQDGVVPYRLEMQARAAVGGFKNLYDFWGRSLYDALMEECSSRLIINLASAEYSKCIEKYLSREDHYVTVIFGEWKDKKIVQKGTMAKMARGEMVRFMSEQGVEDIEGIKKFSGLGYRFEESLGDKGKLVFIKKDNLMP